MSTYVLIHGAWHTGGELEEVAEPIRAAGHEVHTPTLAGNRPGDPKTTTLKEAIQSAIDFINENELSDIILLGHSYGGMVISGVADQMPDRIRRLIYWNAFVPANGESIDDLSPPHYVALFDDITADDGSVMLPFPIWREAFINDADLATAESTYARLNPHPIRTLKDKIELSNNLAELQVGKSYLNAQQDIAMPHSLPWHPRMSEKLGLFRLVEMQGSHEVCFSNPRLLAEKIMEAGRD